MTSSQTHGAFRHRPATGVLLLLGACTGPVPSTSTSTPDTGTPLTPYDADADGDGFTLRQGDCDDD